MQGRIPSPRRPSRLATLALGALIALPAPADDAARARGAALLAPFKRELMQALKAGMAKGPEAALTTCRSEAPRIAAAQSQGGVRMGRSSHRLRNPANAAPAWAVPLLEAYLEPSPDRAPRAVELDAGRRGYVEPILVQPLCVTCHGKALAPDLAQRIAELYPRDRATGFAVGELRGIFWVEFPLD